MSVSEFERSVRIERPVEEVFAWHERPAALQRLTPPWEHIDVLEQQGGIRDGARVSARVRFGPMKLRWELEHSDYAPPVQFRDVQRSGPFSHWEHWHRFEAAGANVSVLTDRIRFEPRGGAFGRWGSAIVLGRLERLFRYRHAVTKADLELEPARAGTVLISGASGLLGSGLVPYLRTQGWRVYRLVRRAPRAADEVAWSPADGRVAWPEGVAIDAVVHLAGENIAGGRWTAARKQAILASRVEGTRAMVAALAQATPRPRVLVSASAAGVYGNTGDNEATEDTPAADDFLGRVCQAWEAEAASARDLGVRTVALRSGVVLSAGGGALKKMLPAFRCGVGGPIGNGRQWMSWIALDDWLDVCRRALVDEEMSGVVNVVAPTPVRNAEFVATLGRVLRRPTSLRVPAAVLRLGLGELADAALLSSSRLGPALLQQRGHRFRFPELEAALRHSLGR
jgi:uncharacterized protein